MKQTVILNKLECVANFNSFDIETLRKNEINEPFCISLIINNKRSFFFGEKCIDTFLKKIFEVYNTNGKNTLTIFSHYLTFDGSILLQNIPHYWNITYSGLFYKGNIYSITLKNTYSETIVIFKCSYMFFPFKLAASKKILNCSEKIEENVLNFNEESIKIKKNKDKIIKYCVKDAEIVCEILSKYHDILKDLNGNWHEEYFSISSVSYNFFKKFFNTHKAIKKTTLVIDNLIRKAYYGGRCEVFGNAESFEKIYHFDFSGMYAQIMHDTFGYGKLVYSEEIKEMSSPGFYNITFISKMEMPILPVHLEDSKLIFPNGIITGLFWWEEIVYFMKNGGEIIKINYGYTYTKQGRIFKNFSEYFTKKRKESHHSNFICKILINSLYGRLGMSHIDEKTVIKTNKEYLKEKWSYNENIISEVVINNLHVISYKEDISDDYEISSNVDLAASITSKARIKLYNGFKSVEKNNGRVLYCDTDSIFAAYKKNVDNEKHGEVFWDIAKKDTKISKAIFALPKAYALIYENKVENVKIKGVSKDKINYTEFERIFTKSENIELKISSLFKRNYIVMQKDIVKLINLKKYDKRKFNSTFTHTTPINI